MPYSNVFFKSSAYSLIVGLVEIVKNAKNSPEIK